MNWFGEGGVMLARGKTPSDMGSYPGCCCYCDLYSLAEWAYRDKLSYPAVQAVPLPYSPGTPCPEHSPGGVSAVQPHKHISPDVASAFLLSLDLLRPYPHQQALHALESHALKHARHRRSSSFGAPGLDGEIFGEDLKGGGGEFAPRPTPPASNPHHVPQLGGGCHNGEGEGGTEGGGGPDEEELGAFWEILENDIRPIKPLPSCPESQKIFSEHKEMARKYLVLQQEIFNLRKHKSILENKLSQAEKLEQLGNQRYQDKIRELESKRENLYHTQSKLKQQLEQICTRQEEQQKRQMQQDDGNEVGLDHLPLAPP